MHDHLEDALAEIRAKGGRVTPARRAVLGAVLHADRHHFTAADIEATLATTRPRPDRATVYRTLELLTELGVLTPLMLDGEATVYHRADHQHGHLVCDRCGVVVEVAPVVLAKVASAIERETGFRIERERVAFGGRCADCAADG